MDIKNKVVGIGELLVRFTTDRGTRIRDAYSFKANYGGAEANVIISLCNLGHEGSVLTRLAKDNLGMACYDYLVKNRVDVSNIVFDDNPLGMYFLEEGEGARASKVVYNRHYSAATKMKEDDFNYEKAFKDASILHISGITLAISESARNTAIKAAMEAKKAGLKVSFDFNYRAKLMSVEDAKKVYPLIAKYADIVSASPWDIKTLLGFHPDETDDEKLFKDACRELGFDYLFTKKRTILSARSQTLKAFAYTKDSKVEGKERKFEIFDRIGAGDAFTAGYLHGLLLDYSDPLSAIEYGIANCVLEQTIFGDNAKFTHEDLVSYLQTSGLEEVKR